MNEEELAQYCYDKATEICGGVDTDFEERFNVFRLLKKIHRL